MFYNERMFELISDLTTMEKLQILADAAKYDVACTSSGVDRKGKEGFLGNSVAFWDRWQMHFSFEGSDD